MAGADTGVPCEKSCVCGPFHNAGKINYPLWWYGQQGILYNFAGGSATPSGCVFKDHGYWFDGNDDYLMDEQGRKILREDTLGLWSSINLDCNNPPLCGSVTGSGTKLYLNQGNVLAPKMSGSLILCSQCCPNIEVLVCVNNSFSILDVSTLTSLTNLQCYNNSISILDVSTLTSLTYLHCAGNSISVLDVSALTLLATLGLQSNSMNQAVVDTVLCDVDNYGTNGGTLNISGNAVPSAAGIACKNSLIGRGWTVTTD